MKPITLPQAFVGVAGLIAIGFAHYAGPAEGTLVSAAVALLLWLQQPPAAPPPAVKTLLLGVVLGVFAGHMTACASLGPVTQTDANALITEGAGLSACQVVGRISPDGGQLKAYEDCVKDGGL